MSIGLRLCVDTQEIQKKCTRIFLHLDTASFASVCVLLMCPDKWFLNSVNSILISAGIHTGPIPEWSVREQLILASAVQRSGDQNWYVRG